MKLEALFLSCVVVLIVFPCRSVFAQQEINLDPSQYRIGTNATKLFSSQGVLFSAPNGEVIVGRDLDGSSNLCAKVVYEMSGPLGPVGVNRCEDFNINLVNPAKPILPAFVSNLKISIAAFGGVRITTIGRSKRPVTTVYAALPSSNVVVLIKYPVSEVRVAIDRGCGDCNLCSLTLAGLSTGKPVPGETDQPIHEIVDAPEPTCAATSQETQSHNRLLNEAYPPEVYRAIDKYRRGADDPSVLHLQSLDSCRETVADEFTTVVKMPARLKPTDIFKDMRRGLDTVGNSDSAERFKAIGTFSYFDKKAVVARPGGLPGIGDILQVNIEGPDNGDVMITGLYESPTNSYFRYSTLTNDLPGGGGTHPNNGSREYGFETLPKGDVRFYVRGVDQFVSEVQGFVGAGEQKAFWINFLQGVADRVEEAGGKIITPAAQTDRVKYNKLPSCYKAPGGSYGGPGM
jgi:hypothetical protein